MAGGIFRLSNRLCAILLVGVVPEICMGLRYVPPEMMKKFMLSNQMRNGCSAPLSSALRLRGGSGTVEVPPTKPPVMHVVAVGTICAAVLILSEMNLLSVVLRVLLTFVLSIIFFLSGINKTTDTFHKPTHLYMSTMFTEVSKKVWRPLVESVINRICHFTSKYVPSSAAYCGDNDRGVFSLAKRVAAAFTATNMMTAVGYIETWCAILLMVSLAGTGSRGCRVPLAELSNVVLLGLMAGAVYTHTVLKDGQVYAPAALGALLLLRFSLPGAERRWKDGKGVTFADKTEEILDEEEDAADGAAAGGGDGIGASGEEVEAAEGGGGDEAEAGGGGENGGGGGGGDVDDDETAAEAAAVKDEEGGAKGGKA